jgi:hypothetical protein
MNVSLWVPQLFYDVIGRLIPGVILALWWLTPFAVANHGFTAWRERVTSTVFAGYPVVVFLVGVIAAYFIAAVLGAMWRLLDSHVANGRLEFRWFKRGYDDACSRLQAANLVAHGFYPADLVAFMYDAIQLRFPKAGARLAKLRAEQHQGGAFVFGFLLAALGHGLGVWPFGILPKNMLLFSAAAVVLAVASYGFLAYICTRAGHAVACLWALHELGRTEN